MTKRSIPALLVTAALTLASCGGAGVTSGAPTAATTSAPTLGPTPSPSTTPYAPIPTFAATFETMSTAPAGAIPVDLTIVDNAPRFLPDTITAKAGTVVFFLHNVPAGAEAPDHVMLISPANTEFFSDGSISSGQLLAGTPALHANDAATFTITDLPAGTYLFWCSVVIPDGGNHEAAGMRGTLTVTP